MRRDGVKKTPSKKKKEEKKVERAVGIRIHNFIYILYIE